MAVTDEWESPLPEIRRQSRAVERRQRTLLLVLPLLIGGILLVVFSGGFGNMLANAFAGSGQWDNDLAMWEMNCRFLGLMAFMAGLVERVLIALADQTDK